MAENTRLKLEHVPQKCERFCEKNMLQHFGASSYRLGDSTQAEHALGGKPVIKMGRVIRPERVRLVRLSTESPESGEQASFRGLITSFTAE